MHWKLAFKGLRPLLALACWASSSSMAVRAQVLAPSQVDALAGRDAGAWAEFHRPALPPDHAGPRDEAEFDALSKGGPWSVAAARSSRALPDARLARLLTLAREGHWPAFTEGLRQDAPDPDARDRDGATLLTLAARQGSLEAAQALLRHGADVDRAGLHGLTPLCAAAMGGHELVVKALLRAGADATRRSAAGQTPLHLAAREGHLGSMRALLRAGADPMALNRAGLHTLAEAASTGQIAAMAVLIDEAGVAPDARDGSGLNALHAAAVRHHMEAAAWLRQRGVLPPHPLTRVLLDRPADPLPAAP